MFDRARIAPAGDSVDRGVVVLLWLKQCTVDVHTDMASKGEPMKRGHAFWCNDYICIEIIS